MASKIFMSSPNCFLKSHLYRGDYRTATSLWCARHRHHAKHVVQLKKCKRLASLTAANHIWQFLWSFLTPLCQDLVKQGQELTISSWLYNTTPKTTTAFKPLTRAPNTAGCSTTLGGCSTTLGGCSSCLFRAGTRAKGCLHAPLLSMWSLVFSIYSPLLLPCTQIHLPEPQYLLPHPPVPFPAHTS